MLDAEINLLTATLSGQPVEECNGHSSRQHSSDGSHVLLRELLQGNFTSALLLPEAQQWLRSDTRQTSNGISDYFEHVRRLLVEKQAAADRWHQLQTAVACLLLFLQANLTGPPQTCSAAPSELSSELRTDSNDSAAPAQRAMGQDSTSADDRWALQQLAADGEEVVGRIHRPQYLLLARILLTAPLGLSLLPEGNSQPQEAAGKLPELASELPSWRWWAARVLSVNQRLLARSAASLRSALQALMPQVVKQFGPGSKLDLGRHQKAVAAAALLESAVIEHLYRSPHTALGHLQAAEAALGMSISLQGAMGVRTAHQVDPKAQLVVTTSGQHDDDMGDLAEESGVLDAMRLGNSAEPNELKGLSGESDVLSAPRIVDGSGAAVQGSLGGLEQAVLLCWAQQVKKGTSADELQAWQMAPYAEAVLRQTRSFPLVRGAGQLMKARHERTRTRTLERSLMHMQTLADGQSQPQPPVMTRLRYAFAVLFPLRPGLRRELGEQLVSTGLVGAAMTIFEQEQLWDSLIICYRLLQKLPQAQQLVQARLKVTPDDASLLCALGDITLDDGHYETAWKVSNGRSTRAQRALARSAQTQQNWAQAAGHWEKALALNPLFPKGWFGLGYCSMKTLNHKRALQAFTRCSQQEPDNGEAWNNIAAIHLQLQHAPEAFSALGEAVKLKRDSWQTWSNYAQAALQTDNNLPAARAVQKVLELTQGERVETEILTVLVQRVQQGRQQDGTDGTDRPGVEHQQRQVEQTVGSAVKGALSSPKCGPAMWGLSAQYNRSMGFPVSAREALLKQVRGLQAGNWQEDAAAFQSYGNASWQLGQLTLDMAQTGASPAQSLASTRMQLKSTLKQAAEVHTDDVMYRNLQSLLTRIEVKEAESRERAQM